MNTPEIPMPQTPAEPLVLSAEGAENLVGAAKWSRIFLYLGIAALVLYAVLMISAIVLCICVPIPSTLVLAFLFVCNLVFVVVVAIAPAVIMGIYSRNTRLAARDCDAKRLEKSSKNMKVLAIYAGVLSIMALVACVINIVFIFGMSDA